MFRILTIGREYGSGGAAIARLAAERLQWKLLDSAIVSEVAARAKVDPALARQYDEAVDSWMHRVARASLWQGGFEGVASIRPTELWDAQTMARLTASMMLEAHQQGNCVIVGRGSQCVLQNQVDVFHAYVYAPWQERMARVSGRSPEVADPAAYIREMDQVRAEYVRRNYGCTWKDPHMYHLMISSKLGEAAAANVIVAAMQG
jgi:cytidylate kinase